MAARVGLQKRSRKGRAEIFWPSLDFLILCGKEGALCGKLKSLKILMQERFSSNNKIGSNWRNFACVQHDTAEWSCDSWIMQVMLPRKIWRPLIGPHDFRHWNIHLLRRWFFILRYIKGYVQNGRRQKLKRDGFTSQIYPQREWVCWTLIGCASIYQQIF